MPSPRSGRDRLGPYDVRNRDKMVHTHSAPRLHINCTHAHTSACATIARIRTSTHARTLFYFPQNSCTPRVGKITKLCNRHAPASPRAAVFVASPSNPLARGPSYTTGSPYHCSWLPQNGPTILSFNHHGWWCETRERTRVLRLRFSVIRLVNVTSPAQWCNGGGG